jgi:hypothetical protein
MLYTELAAELASAAEKMASLIATQVSGGSICIGT